MIPENVLFFLLKIVPVVFLKKKNNNTCLLNKKIDKQKVKINFLDFSLCLSLSVYF